MHSQRLSFIGILLCCLLLPVAHIHIAAPAHAATVPQTGQDTMFLAGDDGNLQTGVNWPVPRFTDNSDGTITDNLTGLIWLKEANCFGAIPWQGALNNGLNLASGLCGLSDGSVPGEWRLPSIRELESLVDLGFFSPAIADLIGTNQAGASDPFDNLQNDEYWSATSSPQEPSSAFTLGISFGHVLIKEKITERFTIYVKSDGIASPPAPVFATGQTTCFTSTGASVDCAGTGQDGDLQSGIRWPIPRFTDFGDGTVHDNLTGLTWLKDAQCFPPTNWETAISLANTLESGTCGLADGSRQGDWRLPNRREIFSLIDFNNFFPAISNTDGTGQWSGGDPFLNIQPNSGYWTSTTYHGFTNSGWFIDFFRGVAGSENKVGLANFLPVRDDLVEELTVEIIGSGTVASSPAGISCPGNCSANFSRNGIVTLQATPDDGNRFVGWSIASCGTGRSCQVSMTAATTVQATFTALPPSVSHWLLLLMN